MNKLQQSLKSMDGKSYKGYKSLQGTYQFQKFKLMIDYVQGDPFAAPSKIRVSVPGNKRKIHPSWLETKRRRIYAEDRLTREVFQTIDKLHFSIKGSGKSGMVAIDRPGQEILERTSVTLDEKGMTICLTIGLPANGRRINGNEAEKLFFQVVPQIMDKSIFSIDDGEIDEAIQLADQHDAIEAAMKENDWVSFVADGAILPRTSGISDRPMKKAVPFKSPEANRVEINLPHREEPLTGMALKKGIVLIVGGGYHGKSTLLKAIERGVYPHIKGDGREYVWTDGSAMKVRAEDGRQVTSVDISPFIKNLPHSVDTTSFTSENASGSTSQAANVMEALEAGAKTLLIDEDTSATNFMIRDQRMQELVVKEKEPITPFIDKVQQLKDQLDISTILVMGGSGDYFDAADEVIMMDHYLPFNVTEKAKDISAAHPAHRQSSQEESFGDTPKRAFSPASIQAQRGKKSKVQAKGRTTIVMGKTDISLHYVEQLVDPSQTRMIADIISYLDKKSRLNEELSLTDLLDRIERQIDDQGLASFAPFQNQHPGELARPRRQEIAATLNRMRTAKVNNMN
ncbi:ABC-ATPase domain-containing protein [Thalassobacillus hwangdonensis]|uniref:ABC-ATPase domain-containing protein n=1 Tax=Thalassobacillus hwangdonensis TaxID=546108 RepID=A0ABW3KZ55_9BACI